MEERKQKILDFVNSPEFTSLKEKEIANLLGVPSEDRHILKQILIELIEEGILFKTNKDRYILATSQGYLNGKYFANEKGFGFVSVPGQEQDVFIAGENTNTALDNDDVLIQIIKEKTEGRKAEGKIIKITKRNTNSLIGKFENSGNFGFVVPDNPKISYDIFVSKTNMLGALNNDKVIVEIINWPTEDKKAEGQITRILGKDADPKLDYVSVVNMYGLEKQFDEEVLKEVEKMPNSINDKDFENRRDLRTETIMTIDSIDTMDIDDAISLNKLDNGNYELGVHIADVSNYVREGTVLNLSAIERGTSVYLINKVIPMLPPELSNGICSLNENVDRCALSIKMTIDQNGKVVSQDIFKSVICSCKKGVYSQINDIYANGEKSEYYADYTRVIDMIKYMKELQVILAKRRENRGSIEFDLYETKVTLDEEDRAINVDKRERGISEQVIEECMLVANETIAETFFHLEAPFIYRVHEKPDADKIFTLTKILNNLNVKVKGMNNIHPKTMQEILKQVEDQDNGKMISTLILRSMQLARYSEENLGHFGISSKYYCHFTSPIRRYPDLFIHRIISKYIETGYNLSDTDIDKYTSQAEEYSQSSSKTERNAERAEREYETIKMCEYMEGKIGEEFDGTISSLTQFGMFIELENTVEGLVRYENMYDDYYDYDEESMCLIGRKTHNKYIIGSKVKVRVTNASKKLRRIDFELI